MSKSKIQNVKLYRTNHVQKRPLLLPSFTNSPKLDQNLLDPYRRSEKTAMAPPRRILLPSLLLILAFFAADLAPPALAIWLSLPSSGTKCVSEEIHSNVVVLGDYVIISPNYTHSPTVGVKVTSPYGNNLYHKEKQTSGQFAFTTAEAGNHLACFWIDSNQDSVGDVSLSIDWKTGISAKDWESVAKKEKIEGVELELRKLEGAVEAIHENLLYLKSREADMRTVSEKTNGRVAWLSIMSLGVCISASALQLWYLRRFFQKKKLI